MKPDSWAGPQQAPLVISRARYSNFLWGPIDPCALRPYELS